MDALVWAGGTAVEVRQVPTPQPGPGWALVEVAYAGLCGTDLHIASNEHPRAKPGVVLGHELVGRVATAVDGLPAGSPVFINPLLVCGSCATCKRGRAHICEHLGLVGIDVDGGAAELVAVPKASLLPLPSGVDLRTAALIEPLSVAVRALGRSRMRFGDRVHVLGAGPIGLLVASCSRRAGAAMVTISEVSPVRAEAARSLGFSVVDHASPEPVADVVFDCTGHPVVSPTIARWLVPGGVVTVVAAYPGVVSVDLQDVMMRELALVGVRVYSAEDVITAMAVVQREGSDLGRLVTAVLPLSEGPSAIAALRTGSELKVLLQGPAA
jgi:2-desacetyl-2-hydroxyethyl bacteriochlorophyllide A dehydrogenase